MTYIKSRLCQLPGLSCIGCCGHSFRDKLSIAKDIEKNTLEFRKQTNQKEFMNRSKGIHSSGICKNIIYDTEQDKVHCPLHPEQNKGKEIRHDHPECDILHVCKTAFLFDLWDNSTKTRFLNFLKKKRKRGMCWHKYSIKMVDESLLNEFEGLKWD